MAPTGPALLRVDKENRIETARNRCGRQFPSQARIIGPEKSATIAAGPARFFI